MSFNIKSLFPFDHPKVTPPDSNSLGFGGVNTQADQNMLQNASIKATPPKKEKKEKKPSLLSTILKKLNIIS
ncbi:MAG: hypothetical protein WCG27_10695 [Pseudomonadota bacterium]